MQQCTLERIRIHTTPEKRREKPFPKDSHHPLKTQHAHSHKSVYEYHPHRESKSKVTFCSKNTEIDQQRVSMHRGSLHTHFQGFACRLALISSARFQIHIGQYMHRHVRSVTTWCKILGRIPTQRHPLPQDHALSLRSKKHTCDSSYPFVRFMPRIPAGTATPVQV